MKKLPVAFEAAMQRLLEEQGRADEAPLFFKALCEGEASPALRLNEMKIGETAFLEHYADLFPSQPQPVPWAEAAFYLPPDHTASSQVAYLQGLYYLQEASAMLPAVLLRARPGDRVLDLCSAPGGKATKLANDLQNRGLLLANEIVLDRAKILVRNVEQWGSEEVVVTHASSSSLQKALPSFFDKILVDAPCSGEGMFLRDPQAIDSWETYAVARCVKLQEEILEDAYALLLPGGELLYSTCTFNLHENEEQVARFLERHDDMELLPARSRLPQSGREWVSEGLASVRGQKTERCLRLWPHRCRGEGHFCALMKKGGRRDAPDLPPFSSSKGAPQLAGDLLRPLLSPAGQQHFLEDPNYVWYQERNFLHRVPIACPSLPGIHILKRGLCVGELRQVGKKGYKLQPALGFALALKKGEAALEVDLSLEEAKSYLAGLTLALPPSPHLEGQTGDVLLFYEQQPVGWARLQGGLLKNLYPAQRIRRI